MPNNATKGPMQESEDHGYLLTTVTPNGHQKNPQPWTKYQSLAGWRGGALLSLIGTVFVGLFNLAITIWVWKHPRNEIEGSIGTLYEGSCAKTRNLNVWIHLLINILSTLLLAASNYCMQVLSAPSRKELAQAHAQRYWLQIGVPSFRNLRRIGRDRTILWMLLLLSSMPLHLMFNSVVFTSLQANNYAVIPTTEEWLHGGHYDTSSFIDINSRGSEDIAEDMDSYTPNLNDTITAGIGRILNRYKRVSTEDCFNKYNSHYMSDAGNVYLIQDGPTVWRNLSSWYPEFNRYTEYPKSDGRSANFTWINLNQPPPWTETKDSLWGMLNASTQKWKYSDQNRAARYITASLETRFPIISSPDVYPSNGWRCPSHAPLNCSVENEFEVPRNRSQWEPFERPVKSCVIEEVAEFCKLRFSFPIALAVIVSNIIKAFCMALLLFGYRNHAAVVTMGDAVAHFLEQPDPETRGRCLQSRQLLETQWYWESAHGVRKDEMEITPGKFKPKCHRWAKAPPPGRWFLTYTV